MAGIAEAYLEQSCSVTSDSVCDATAIRRQIENLTAKRGRILEAFFDGTIDRGERDEQLGKVDSDLKAHKVMSVTKPVTDPLVSTSELVDILSVFAEMPFLRRDDKRNLLRRLGVRVSVSGYKISEVTMWSVGGNSNTDSRSKTVL